MLANVAVATLAVCAAATDAPSFIDFPKEMRLDRREAFAFTWNGMAKPRDGIRWEKGGVRVMYKVARRAGVLNPYQGEVRRDELSCAFRSRHLFFSHARRRTPSSISSA